MPKSDQLAGRVTLGEAPATRRALSDPTTERRAALAGTADGGRAPARAEVPARMAVPKRASAPEIVLDISRLVSRILHHTPTGVDRVELVYARELLRRTPERLRFGAVHPTGIYGRVPTATARDFIERTVAAWEGEGTALAPDRLHRLAGVARTLITMRPRPVPRNGSPKIFLQASPHHLHDQRMVETILRRENAALVCLLHDLIPITFPEYARPGGDALHRRRIDTVARLATGVIANSAATLHSFRAHVGPSGRTIAASVAHLGVEGAAAAVATPAADRPCFVCLGTIEPRKNHLLLLNIWRDLSERYGAHAIPKLLIIGRRGWENEQVIDMLDRCRALDGCVEELGPLPDSEVRAHVARAHGLLLPSFAEGFGMPVPEALSIGVPVICSDLPSLREAGGDAPLFLDPLDGIGWRDAILALASDPDAQAAHRARIARWSPPTWDAHIETVLAMVERVAS